MKITIELDADVAAEALYMANSSGRSFDDVINEILLAGLKKISDPINAKLHITRGQPMGLQAGLNLDNIQDLIAKIEGEDVR